MGNDSEVYSDIIVAFVDIFLSQVSVDVANFYS